jgi:hypothetical protein
MKKADLIQIMVDLELANDELRAEIADFDKLMRRVGFSNGIETVKTTAKELNNELPPTE